jgi:hypothetical protein
MTDSQAARQVPGMSTTRHPRRVIHQEHAAYEARFGSDFADSVTRGSWLVVVGGWVMVVGLFAMIVIGIAVFFATGSLPSVEKAMFVGFGTIVVGFILSSIGTSLRNKPIGNLSARIIAFDPNVTVVARPGSSGTRSCMTDG